MDRDAKGLGERVASAGASAPESGVFLEKQRALAVAAGSRGVPLLFLF